MPKRFTKDGRDEEDEDEEDEHEDDDAVAMRKSAAASPGADNFGRMPL